MLQYSPEHEAMQKEIAELTIKLNDLKGGRAINAGRLYIPDWLESLMGTRERAIANDPEVKVYQTDLDGNRLERYQQMIESPIGRFTIDAFKRKIIG